MSVVVVLLLVLLLECRRTVVLLECRRIEYYFFGLMSLLGRRADTRKIDLSLQCFFYAHHCCRGHAHQ